MNEPIYIHEIIKLHADDEGVCLSNDQNMVTINPYTLVDWLPNIIELALKQKAIHDDEKIEELKNVVNGKL
jgi:hypothetical protein